MENNTGSAEMKQPVQNKKAIVVNQIVLRNIDRTMKDIQTWRQAHQAAERVVWPIRQRLYDLYKDVELDGHLSGLIQKRFDAVLNKKIYFKNSAGEKVEDMDKLIREKQFYNLRKTNLHTILWGTSGAEFIPGKKFDWVEVPRKHIKPEYKVIAKEQYGFEGFDYEKMPNIIVFGECYDLGLLLKCSPYALWKRGGMADYAQFVEIFGQPVRTFKYDAYDTETKKQLVDIVEESGSSLALMIPKQAEFEMMDGKTTNANGDLQTQFIECLNNEMSVIVLGNTETTTSSQSSGYAQSKEHGKQQMEITKSDMEYEMRFLNSEQFLTILKSYNFPVEGGEFSYEEIANENELLVKIQVDSQLSKLVPMDDDYFYNTYQRPKPANYDELKEKMNQAAEQEAMPDKPKKKAAKKKPAEDDDSIENEVEDLMDKPAFGRKFRLWLADFFAPAP